MKKFLSLVLALVMTMSLVTISAGAKEFADDDAITYDEAINVISEIGVVDGYTDGDFKPTNTLTRQAAAKIICNMILGPTTASELHADTAPFSDVPITSEFAGYIAYCAKEGIISGYADGTFKPGNTLTGYAFMKMLLGALGYDQDIEGYIGANWSISVAKRAKDIGLDKSLVSEFNGVKAVTREEACLYAFNALQADLVEYETSLSVNSAGNLTGLAIAKARTFQNSATKIEYIKEDNIIQFAEQYFTKLQKKDDTDAFGRPAYTWVYDKKEIGTYVDYTTLVAEYTKKVTGKTLYEEITKSVLDDSKILIYVDGETEKSVLTDAYFGRNQIAKSYDETVGETGNGVLTQVFVDTDADEVIITVINTYLAQALEDYDEKNDDVELRVYSIDDVTGKSNFVKTLPSGILAEQYEDMKIKGEDFAIEDIEEDDLFLVTVADGEIQTVDAPEIISDATISAFKLDKYVTSDGTQYDYASTAQYEYDVLYQYDKINMKDTTYNIILDPYGYMIGLEQNEDPDQYLFLAGLDAGASDISAKNADANVVFLDGTIDTVTVNMKDSKDASNKRLTGGSQKNTWCTYTVDKNGVYTLEEVAINPATGKGQHAQNVPASAPKTINKKNVTLVRTSSPSMTYVYGNDDTVYLNLELDAITDKTGLNSSNNVWIVDDVESVTVGVKNVDLTVNDLGTVKDGYYYEGNEIYTLYDKDNYIIAAVTLEAENNGSTSNYAYITSGYVHEAYLGDDEWEWTVEAIVNGEEGKLTEVGAHPKVLDTVEAGKWYEVRYDADGNVRSVKPNDALTEPYAIAFKNTAGKFINDVARVEASVNANDTVVLHQDFCTYANYGDTTNNYPTTGTAALLTFDETGTLYVTTNVKTGFSVSPDVKVVLSLASSKHKAFDDVEELTGYKGLQKALNNLDDVNGKLDGFLSVIFENGVATIIVLDDRTGPKSNVNDAAAPSVTVTASPDPATEGNTVTLSASVSNAAACGTLTYQWYKDLDGDNTADDNEAIAGATKDTLVIENVTVADHDDATYICKVLNTDTSKEITGDVENDGENYVTLSVSPKAPETMDIIVTFKDGNGVVVGSDLLTGKTATGSVVTVDPSTLTAPTGYKVTDTVTKYVPFVANTAGSVEITVTAKSNDSSASNASATTTGANITVSASISGQNVTVAVTGTTVANDTIEVTLTATDSTNATVSGTATLTYDGSDWNTGSITITAEDGTTTTYTVAV